MTEMHVFRAAVYIFACLHNQVGIICITVLYQVSTGNKASNSYTQCFESPKTIWYLHPATHPPFSSQAQAAIESFGVPPRMYAITAKNSVSGGINITRPDSMVRINNCTVKDNAGQCRGETVLRKSVQDFGLALRVPNSSAECLR